MLPSVHVGRNCHIEHCVIEKGCEIPEGTEIGLDEQADARNYYISPEGVRVVTPEMLGQVSRYVR